MLARHVADIDARMRELKAFRATLRAAIAECDRALQAYETIGCPVVENLTHAIE